MIIVSVQFHNGDGTWHVQNEFRSNGDERVCTFTRKAYWFDSMSSLYSFFILTPDTVLQIEFMSEISLRIVDRPDSNGLYFLVTQGLASG